MTVYVDNMKMKAQVFRWNAVWSNLWADTTEELIAAADELDLSVMSMVDKGYVTERYMITEKKRLAALEHGARAIVFGGPAMLAILRAKKSAGYQEKGL